MNISSLPTDISRFVYWQKELSCMCSCVVCRFDVDQFSRSRRHGYSSLRMLKQHKSMRSLSRLSSCVSLPIDTLQESRIDDNADELGTIQ